MSAKELVAGLAVIWAIAEFISFYRGNEFKTRIKTGAIWAFIFTFLVILGTINYGIRYDFFYAGIASFFLVTSIFVLRKAFFKIVEKKFSKEHAEIGLSYYIYSLSFQLIAISLGAFLGVFLGRFMAVLFLSISTY